MRIKTINIFNLLLFVFFVGHLFSCNQNDAPYLPFNSPKGFEMFYPSDFEEVENATEITNYESKLEGLKIFKNSTPSLRVLSLFKKDENTFIAACALHDLPPAVRSQLSKNDPTPISIHSEKVIIREKSYFKVKPLDNDHTIVCVLTTEEDKVFAFYFISRRNEDYRSIYNHCIENIQFGKSNNSLGEVPQQEEGDITTDSASIGLVQEEEIIPMVLAYFEIELGAEYAPMDVTFWNKSENAETFKWEFSNGVESSKNSPVISFNEPGKFTATLIASNENDTNTYSMEFEVKEPPFKLFNLEYLSLNKVPQHQKTGERWDPYNLREAGRNPDIYYDLRLKNQSLKTNETNEIVDVKSSDLPVKIPVQYPLSNLTQYYEIHFYDRDEISTQGDQKIAKVSFKPKDLFGSNKKKLKSKDGTLEVTLEYSWK